MKKIRLAGLALVAPLCLLCACTTQTPLSFSANWYSDTALNENISDTYEHLEYKVEFKEAEEKDFSVAYDPGTYTTTLKSELATLPDGTSETVYVYSTELKISGRYTFNGETSDTFEDSVSSEVMFRNVKKGLAPVSSTKTVKTTSPVQNADSLEESFKEYHYTYDVSYNVELTEAKITFTDLNAETPEPAETTVAIAEGGTYLDNEQILFALRGLDLSTQKTFRSINPVVNNVQTVSIYSPSSTTVSLSGAEIDGVTDDYEIAAYAVNLGYQTSFPGGTQVAYYAQTVATNNTYRNVLLYLEVPVMQSLGTLRYTLVKAQFAEK